MMDLVDYKNIALFKGLLEYFAWKIQHIFYLLLQHRY